MFFHLRNNEILGSACHTGSQVECEKAPFVPGYNLAGEGFDVVRMRRKGAFLINVKSHMDNGTCTVCKNRFQGGQIQKLPSAVLDWRPFSRCSKQLSSALHHSVDSLMKSSTYRVADHPELSTEFSRHLQRLPTQYDEETKPLYRRTIDTYGTHYIRQVHLGGRVRRVTAFRTCLATLKGLSETDIKNCLNIELKDYFGVPSNNMSMGFYQGFMTHKIEVLGGEKYFPDLVLNQSPAEAYSNWVKSLHDNPEVISYPIFPLYHLVADPEVSANLKRAVTAYIDENMLSVNHKENQGCSQTPNLDHNCCPMQASCGKLVVMVQRAAGLKADLFTRTDGYVKVWYYLMYEETEVVMDNNDPEWNISYDLGSVEFGHELIFEVWDSDVIYNDMVGRCVVSPERGTHSHSCKLKRGILYFTYNTVHNDFSIHKTGNCVLCLSRQGHWFIYHRTQLLNKTNKKTKQKKKSFRNANGMLSFFPRQKTRLSTT
uniref:Uncharacterized protein n=1 Tax=Sinocyclocheilus anshuiensis TaxID=1608454 RepID=A0A671LIP7_9TELE